MSSYRWQTASLKVSRLMDLRSMVERPRVLGLRELDNNNTSHKRGEASADGVPVLEKGMCTCEVTHELKPITKRRPVVERPLKK